MKYLSAIILPILSPLLAEALVVEATPGTLKTAVSDPASATTLTVNGRIDASDLFFIAQEMPGLVSLNLSNTEIVAYQGAKLNGCTSYPANTIPQGVFGATKLENIVFPTTTGLTIGPSAFSSSALKTLMIPANVSGIGMGAFSDCDALTTVSLTNAISEGYAFKGCNNLTNVNLGATVATGTADFASCPKLSDVITGQNLSAIGDMSFQSCPSLQSFDFGAKITVIGELAFAHTGLKAADLQSCTHLDSIGAWAFAYDAELNSVSIPDGVSAVGEGAFFDATSLESMVYPSSCTYLAAYILKGASGMTHMQFPQDVETIGSYALCGASAVDNLTLPSALQYIGDNAMEGTTSLKSIDATTLTEVPQLGTDVWSGVDQSDVTLYAKPELGDAFTAADQWKEFKIDSTSTNVDAPAIESETTVRARFNGYLIEIESTGTEITSVALYDVDGTSLTNVNTHDYRLTVDTSSTNNKLFIVVCSLSSGKTVTLKMWRK